MNKIVFVILVLLCTLKGITQSWTTPGNEQINARIKVINGEDKSPLPGSTVRLLAINRTAIADSNGIALFKDIKENRYNFEITHIGFKKLSGTVSLTKDQPEAETVPLRLSILAALS